MSDKTKRMSLNIPSDMLKEMDRMIDEIGFAPNRSAYVTRAMDSLFRILLQSRLNIDKQVETIKKIQEVQPETIVAITKGAMQIYVQNYDEYKEKKDQLLVTLPVDLIQTIESYAADIGLYETVDQFILVSISNQISMDENMLENMKLVREHRAKDKKTQEEVISSVLNKIQNNESGGLDALVGLVSMFMEASKK